jgi:hypothetical protein
MDGDPADLFQSMLRRFVVCILTSSTGNSVRMAFNFSSKLSCVNLTFRM